MACVLNGAWWILGVCVCARQAQVMSGVRSAAAGGNVSMALLHNGDVFVWGGVKPLQCETLPLTTWP